MRLGRPVLRTEYRGGSGPVPAGGPFTADNLGPLTSDGVITDAAIRNLQDARRASGQEKLIVSIGTGTAQSRVPEERQCRHSDSRRRTGREYLTFSRTNGSVWTEFDRAK